MTFSVPSNLSRFDLFLAVALAVGFCLAGWKIASRPANANFLPITSQTAISLPSPKSVQGTGLAAGNIGQLSPDGRFHFDARFVSSEPGQAVHAASIAELRDGNLRAVWFSGSREGAGDVAVKTAVFNSENFSWGQEATLFDRKHLQQDLRRYVKKIGNPVIARLPDGSLMLWMVNVSLGGWAGSSISWSRSGDDGLTWSAVRRLVTSPFLNISTLVKGAPFFYENGEIGLPSYHEFITKSAEILRIDSDGLVTDKNRIPDSQSSLQPVVLVQDPVRAHVYMRSGRSTPVMVSNTLDAGKTWSPTRATPLPNPDSALAGVVTANGGQWLALNPDQKNRQVLSLLHTGVGGAVEGATPWVVELNSGTEVRLSVKSYERLLVDELKARGANEAQVQADVNSSKRQLCGAETCSQEFSYPYLLQSRDGALHLVYTWHRSRIKHVRIDPGQILQLDAALPAPRRATSTSN